MSDRFTQRLAKLQAENQKNESLEDALRDIAGEGVTNIHVMGDESSLSFSYSTGLYDTWGQPEVIMTGFPVGLASSILNQVARWNADGQFIRLNERVPELITKGIDCVFRPVTHEWVKRLMLRSLWFYGEVPFPAIQCICPDFGNVFPWEDGFDQSWRSRQALLYKGVEKTLAEKRLWSTSAAELIN